MPNRLEILQGRFQSWEALWGIWEAVIKVEVRQDDVTGGGENWIIGVVHDVSRVRATNPPTVRGKVWRSESQVCVAIAQSISNAYFTESANGISDVDTTRCPV